MPIGIDERITCKLFRYSFKPKKAAQEARSQQNPYQPLNQIFHRNDGQQQR
jgi:hypothetical protein